MEVDILVFDRAPQSLDEDVVAPTAAPVHADPDVSFGERAREIQARELTALVGVEDLGLAHCGPRCGMETS